MTSPTKVQRSPEQWVITIGEGNLASEIELTAMLSELETSLIWIRERVEEGDSYFSFNFIVALQDSDLKLSNDDYAATQWLTPQAREEWRIPPADEIDFSTTALWPWTLENRRFWIEVARCEAVREQASAVLKSMEKLVRFAHSADTSGDGLWEADEVQFGEVALTVLAQTDLVFVTFYTRLLRCWDMDHEVTQLDSIQRIVSKHGICEETEELLFARLAENPGQHGEDQVEDLYPFLQDQYGDFVSSDLFQRAVTKVTREHLAELAANPRLIDQTIFHYAKVDALRNGAKQIRADLENIS